ncbi:hypothetical protein NMG60_11013994 [Bertholletia excelsa]
MSQEQPRRSAADQLAVKYGDLFNVSKELAAKPVAPQDAATMQAAENMTLGNTQRGGPAAVMQSAAAVNEKLGAVGHYDYTDIARDQGVTVTETDVGGRRIVTESVGDQVVGQYTQPVAGIGGSPAAVTHKDGITIGEALEASTVMAGNKPINQSDAAAIQAAEARATGTNEIASGGVGGSAQSAANWNARTARYEEKTRLGEVLGDATEKLPSEKAATREDAEVVRQAELGNNPRMATHPGGVADSVAAAARLNMK